MDCLFCKIIKGEIPNKTIYEDEKVKVFLDINPNTNGDTLIVPKKHYQDFRDLDNDILIYMHEIIKKIYSIYQEKLHCDGLTIINNSDYAQEIKHYHLHFMPRYKNDDLKVISNKDLLNNLDEITNILTNDQ